MSQHDLRPEEALNREIKEKIRKEREEQVKLDKFLGKTHTIRKDFQKYFREAGDKYLNFIDHKFPNFLDKGPYIPPHEILSKSLLRGEVDIDVNFKLFHRQLRANDKHLFFGEAPSSKY